MNYGEIFYECGLIGSTDLGSDPNKILAAHIEGQLKCARLGLFESKT